MSDCVLVATEVGVCGESSKPAAVAPPPPDRFIFVAVRDEDIDDDSLRLIGFVDEEFVDEDEPPPVESGVENVAVVLLLVLLAIGDC